MDSLTSLSPDDYQELTDIEHILTRYDMYIGPIDRTPRSTLCLTDKSIVSKTIYHSEGMEQTFLEILGNAADNVQRSREHNIQPGIIEVTIDSTTVTVKNYGMNIPIAQNQNGKWVPELIFGQLRTSSNYNDNQKRLYIGKNGLGAKATNIFSKLFQIECGDPTRQLYYTQTWENNMHSKSQPTINSYNGPGFTQVIYSLDFNKFGIPEFDTEALEIYGAHCVAVAYTCNVPVYFNGTKFIVNDIFDYTKYFFQISRATTVMYKDPGGVYDICLIDTPDNAITISFVNGIMTKQGGVHVDAAYKVVTETIISYFGSTVDGIKITKRDIDRHVSMFLSCRLSGIQFKSQTKDYLAKPVPKIDIPPENLKPIKKWALIEIIHKEIMRKQMNQLKKTDGTNSKVKSGKCCPANFSGNHPRHLETILIMTEGDSADKYSFKFISRVPNRRGRDFYGNLPLHGKLLNVLNADFLQILNNRDIINIKKNLGLKEEVDYSVDANFAKLNYGSILIMPDPDNDGKHILGLVLLFFIVRFHSLVVRGYINFLRIPVIRVTVNGKRLLFYSMSRYTRYINELNNPKISNLEYFKGLGSSEDHHIDEDYKNPKLVKFYVDDKAAEKIILAFNKVEAENRKRWLAEWATKELIETEDYEELPVSLFIDHELIDYSIENVIRSIPEAMDGFKDVQRKAFFAALVMFDKRKSEKIKTAQVASNAALITCYKHGESCLADAISMMAQDFTGSNNMPYFTGKGQFGDRNEGTRSFSSPRYTAITAPWWRDLIYRKDDKRLENRLIDEGEERECETFFPIIPMHLVNGVVGIGTAYSTNIPSHNPVEIAFWLQSKIKGWPSPVIKPWYKGFMGDILITNHGFTTVGKYKHDRNIIVNEIPIGMWYVNYVEFLDKLLEERKIINYNNNCTDQGPYFELVGFKDATNLNNLNLIRKHSYSNMTVLYRTANRGIAPKIYDKVEKILEDFYEIRRPFYYKRKELIIGEIDKEIAAISARKKFIKAVAVDKNLEIRNRPEADIYNDMSRLDIDRSLLDKVKSREFTQERVIQLENKISAKIIERENISKTAPEDIWFDELDSFIKSYCKHEKMPLPSLETCNVVTLELSN
jgi:DNA topoisomerase-2